MAEHRLHLILARILSGAALVIGAAASVAAAAVPALGQVAESGARACGAFDAARNETREDADDEAAATRQMLRRAHLRLPFDVPYAGGRPLTVRILRALSYRGNTQALYLAHMPVYGFVLIETQEGAAEPGRTPLWAAAFPHGFVVMERGLLRIVNPGVAINPNQPHGQEPGGPPISRR